MIATLCVIAWLVAGASVAPHLAKRAYYGTRRQWPTLAANNPREGRGEAVFALSMSVIFGPISIGFALLALLIRTLGGGTVDAFIPELRAEEDKRQREEQAWRIRDLEAQIDEAHRQLGIAPLRRTS